MKILFVVYCGETIKGLDQTLESIPKGCEQFQSKTVIVSEIEDEIGGKYNVYKNEYRVGPLVSAFGLLEPDINFLSIVRPGDRYFTRSAREGEEYFLYYMRSMGDDLGIIYSDYTTEIAEIPVNVYQTPRTIPPLWGSFINVKALSKCNCLSETNFEEIYKKIARKFVVCHVPKFPLHLIG